MFTTVSGRLRYGIVPLGATAKTTPGRCKAKAHRRATLGLPGRQVLVSRKWSGKTLPDHRADREAFVRQLLTDIGITKPTPDPGRYTWDKVRPGDPGVPRRLAHARYQRYCAEIASRNCLEFPGESQPYREQFANKQRALRC